MKIDDVKSEEMVSQYIAGCLNDFEAGIATKQETELHIHRLIIHLIKRDRQKKWMPIDKMPSNCFVIIKTKTGIIRIAKQRVYTDSSTSIHYGSTYFKDVVGWQPLPQ